MLVQTRIPGHEALAAAVHADPGAAGRGRAAGAAVSSACRRSAPWPCCAAPGRPAYADGLAAGGRARGVGLGDDRFLVRADDHVALADGLAAVARPAGRLRVEVDPTDA